MKRRIDIHFTNDYMKSIAFTSQDFCNNSVQGMSIGLDVSKDEHKVKLSLMVICQSLLLIENAHQNLTAMGMDKKSIDNLFDVGKSILSNFKEHKFVEIDNSFVKQ